MHKLGDLAEYVGGELVGQQELTIQGIAALEDAGPGDITFAADLKAVERARSSGAGAVIVPAEAGDVGKPAIRTDHPRLAFAKLLALFAPVPPRGEGVHATALVEATAQLGQGVWLREHVSVGARSRIGDGVVLHPGVRVGADVEIGAGTVIHGNAVIGDRVRVGENCILHAGVVLGADGFGFAWDGSRHVKIPQIGTVVVEDDVEIGANSTVDRATLGVTRIGRGSRIDNLVQIGHNAELGENAVVVALVGVAGSARVGDRVTLAGQSGVSDHQTVGADTVVGARGFVAGEVPPGSFVSGFPARPHSENMRILAATRRLPELVKTVGGLQRRVAELERRLEEGAAPEMPTESGSTTGEEPVAEQGRGS